MSLTVTSEVGITTVGARAILLSKDLLLKEGTFMAMEVKLLVGDQDFGIPDQGFLLPSTGATTATSSVIGRKRALTQELLTAPSPIISSGITESTAGFNTKKSRGISFETGPSSSVSDSSMQDNLLIENLSKIENQGFSISNSGNCIQNFLNLVLLKKNFVKMVNCLFPTLLTILRLYMETIILRLLKNSFLTNTKLLALLA